MARLRDILAANGFDRPRTYIQSGNLVFGSGREADGIRSDLAELVAVNFGFEPDFLLLPASEFSELVEACPFSPDEHDPARIHVFFHLDESAALKMPTYIDGDPAVLVQGRKAHYLNTPDGLSRSKLAEQVSRRIGRITTARNLKTCQNILRSLSE
jgi:uncharacterized protein (DUF1697 family)